MITIESILKAYQLKGYKVADQDDKNYNLNIGGVRNSDLSIVNQWNDLRLLFWKFKGQWNLIIHAITTKPGLYFLLDPEEQRGTFILKEGQYLGAYQKGLAFGTRPALIQIGNLTGYTDNKKDGKFYLTEGTEITGNNFGIEMHGVWNASDKNWRGQYNTVDNWSAGCNVTQNTDDHDIFMSLCDKAVLNWGNSFSYTLINESDLQL